MFLSRRSFLAATSAGLIGSYARGAADTARPKIAAVVTEYRKNSHAQHICDRFLEGYSWHGRRHQPAVDLVSLYVDQSPTNDLSKERARRHAGLRICPTVAEALTLGGEKLAVDGVLLIGEHGKYPRNEKGQHLYPRYEFFRQTVEVFRRSGRSVPVFNDKHLSWKWDWAKEMVDTARELKFPFMAGSSLPVTWRMPAVDMPSGAEVEEAMCIAYGGVDSYDFHALETIQCMVERRRGGETGVVAVQALRGDAVWKAMQAGSWSADGWDKQVFDACLSRSQTLRNANRDLNPFPPREEDIPRLVADPVAYRIEYADGVKATMLLLNGLVSDFTFAARLKGRAELLSTMFHLPPPDLAGFFDPLAHHIESLLVRRQSPYPVERTLLTTGLVAAGVESLWQKQARIATPHLAIRYSAPTESQFVRE